ncbi:hypothetical protein IFM89_031596 [Coptis chinensis]|uniref:G-patch domain-containing protein n=1 Tax=Coptis chinensis TaxID=261450 RepID=A0A835HCQ8_9MAGN|nr:hypothetical protein IFM89_031596 [Coptis chinensis]
MENFGMENDYEEGQWIGGEYYYKKQRKDKKRHQTKDDVLFGVFADVTDSSDDDDDNSSRKRRKKDMSSKKYDLTKPVNFVSTGTVMPNQEIDRNIQTSQNEDGDAEVHAFNGLGLNSGLGLGFGSKSFRNDVLVEGDGEEEEESFLPTAFGRKIKEGAMRRERDREREKSKVGKKVAVGKRENNVDANVGEFEKHTKGIASRMMEKMGYKGGGLGKNQQGIVAPIEVKLRPKNMGMGFKDYKEAKTMPVLQEPVEEEKPKVLLNVSQPKEKLWSKQNRRKKKEKYVTAEELLASKEENSVEFVQTVLDMRGPQVRVLTNLENLNAEENLRENDAYLPELQHNIKLIVELAELDIQKLDRDLRYERENAVSLQKEREKLQKDADRQKKQLHNMQDIAQVLERIEQENTLGTLTIDSLLQSFGDLQRRYMDEFKLCNLPCVACSLGLPLFIKVFQSWDPLQHPSHGLKLMALWKNLLEDDSPFEDVSSPFSQLAMEVVLPAVWISGTNSWNPRDPEPMLKFLELWEELLPASVLQNILDNVVLLKLSQAVDTWDPLRENIAIHVWVHPWLPLLGQKLETFYRTIQIKLGKALLNWHPSDGSAYTILSPWKTVFDTASWERLIVQYIVPKLASELQNFEVNPSNQKLDQFSWVMSWVSAIPIHHMVTMLEVSFFPKWQQVLYHWLCANPNFGEVTQWYLGWKGLLPQELLANERVRYHLDVGLEMMNQAVDGMEVVQPGARENISYLRVTEKRQFEAQQKAAAYAQQQASASGAVNIDELFAMPVMSLKEVIEAFAQENELFFKPKPGRTHNGQQIYGFGNISIYIDTLNNKIFAQSLDGWSVVTLERLKEMHYKSKPKKH